MQVPLWIWLATIASVTAIVFTTNAFALLGLVELYFLIGGLLKKLVYLSLGPAVVLGFIGIKLVIEAMHGTTGQVDQSFFSQRQPGTGDEGN